MAGEGSMHVTDRATRASGIAQPPVPAPTSSTVVDESTRLTQQIPQCIRCRQTPADAVVEAGGALTPRVAASRSLPSAATGCAARPAHARGRANRRQHVWPPIARCVPVTRTDPRWPRRLYSANR